MEFCLRLTRCKALDVIFKWFLRECLQEKGDGERDRTGQEVEAQQGSSLSGHQLLSKPRETC